MKIVIDLTSLYDNWSGIERYAANMAKELTEFDNANEYILVFKNQIHKLFNSVKKKNIKYIVIKGKNKLIFNQIILPFHLYKYHADKYLFFAFPSPIFLRRKGIFNTIHDMGHKDCPSTMKMKSRLYFGVSYFVASKVSEKIITVSDFSKERINFYYPYTYGKVEVIHSGYILKFLNQINTQSDTNEVKYKYNLPDKYFLCLSTLEPRKNMNLLIKTYKEILDEKVTDHKLVLVGRKGWKIQQMLEEIHLLNNPNIILTGFVDDEDLPIIYKKADCFIFPSIYEGFGLPPIEAMLMKVPVISSNAASLPEILGENCWYFENNNSQDLKRNIIEFLKCSETEKINIVNNAYEWAKQYSFRKSAEILYRLL